MKGIRLLCAALAGALPAVARADEPLSIARQGYLFAGQSLVKTEGGEVAGGQL
jgi:hypothetical protein